MKKMTLVAITVLAFFVGAPGTSLAGPDTYLGDAAIYAAVDSGVNRPKPHVLLLIDTSLATLNRASGTAYVFDPAVPYLGSKDPWSVYASDNQGNFSTLEVASATADLDGITCRTAVGLEIINTLKTSGTYSGSGTDDSPNLRGGSCVTGPKGASYALGSYLNYLNTNTASGGMVVQNTYDCMIGRKTGSGYSYSALQTDACIGTFEYTGADEHIVGEAGTEPGVGADWPTVWTQTSGGCVAGMTNCSTTSLPLVMTVPDTIPTWNSMNGTSLTPTSSFAGGTQRAIIHKVLSQVVYGARGAVKFGAMTYNPLNQGGNIAYGMADVSNLATYNAFMAAVPGQQDDGTLTGAPTIVSGPNRPQAEALFDAGYYLGARYPATTGAIPSTLTDDDWPLDNSTFVRSNVSTRVAGTYADTNRNPCEYNHIILITNGLSFNDSNPKLQTVVDADGDARPNEAAYGNGSHYLDDVAAYLNKQEGMVTHTILAFQTADPLISGAANDGGGKFYNVYDAKSLAKALSELLASIVLETDTSFVAPVVPASSTNRTISSNRVYLGLFKPQSNRPWLGNLKKYGVNSNLALVDRSGALATKTNGDFEPNSKSYWGSDSSGNIMSIDGLLPKTDPDTLVVTGSIVGDGGNVAAGGAGGSLKLNLMAGLGRNLYTKPPASTSNILTHPDNHFSTGNALITETTLNVVAADRDKLINFVSGYDSFDVDNDQNRSEVRDWVMGDILHSKPLVFSYSKFTEAQEANCSINKSMIYVGSNDGMFHAFRDCDGSEAWAFIPGNVLPMLNHLRGSGHTYFVDGSVTAYVHDINDNNIIEAGDINTLGGGDRVVLIFGQRRGGGGSTLDAAAPRGAYYAIDVSNPEVPVLLWTIDSTTAGFGELGETWTAPRLAKVKLGTQSKVAMFIGAGYDNNEDRRYGDTQLFPVTTATTDTTLPSLDSGPTTSNTAGAQINPRGRGIYAIEVATLVSVDGRFSPDFNASGTKLWSYVHADHSEVTFSFPTDLTVMDVNVDSFSDRIYAGDTGGRMWRFDIGANDVNFWTGRMIFKANGDTEATKGRKFFYRPTAVSYGSQVLLYFGTGDREHPLNTAVTDRLFMLRDKGQTTPVDSSRLKDLTANRLQATDATAAEIELILAELGSVAPTFAPPNDNYGWYVTLERPGEKVLASPLVFNAQALFTTYTPTPTASLSLCEVGNLGTSRLYQLDYLTAEAVFNYDSGAGSNDDNVVAYATNLRAKGDNAVVLQKIDREMKLGVGIPSGIVTLIDASGKVVLMISSSNRIGTYGSTDTRMITPLYWLQW